ncbi:MAG: PKD domain-containing protein, partial [Methanoregula sp.]|nr:PKD domain-containing protein [Methanoregula sp.]
VTDIYGRTSSRFNGIAAKKGFNPDFEGEPRLGYAPLNVTFTDLTPDSEYAASAYWSFGDEERIRYWEQPLPRTLFHNYLAPGKYNVTLTYYEDRPASVARMNAAGTTINEYEGHDAYSYYKTKEFYIVVTSPAIPEADLSANVTSGKAPLAVNFDDVSTGLPTGWNWTFGDLTTSADQNPVHIYPSAGNYTVSLTATNREGSNTSIKTDYITVFPSHPPAADFTANTTVGKSPLAVAFTDNSTNSPVNRSWDFGDDTNSTVQNPVHVYTAPGKYSVSLRVMNDDGSDTETRTEYITVLMELPTITIAPPQPVLPISNFTATPLSGKEPLTVVFNDSSTGIPVSWSWSFGDGQTSPERNPAHTYTSAGNFTVSLTATNPHGGNTTTRVDYITVFPRSPPVASFVGTPLSGKAPLTVAFNDTSAGFPTSWLWALGDGTNSTDQNPVHTYSSAGNFTVSLAATNPDGSNTTTITDYIIVFPVTPPVAAFTSNITAGKIPLVVAFTDASTGSPTGWNWTFGDGTTSSEQDPVHVFTTPGQFTVSLQVTNPDGSDTTTKAQFISGNTPVLPVA